MDLGLAGKKAIVTGGTGGIGLAIVETLAAEGAQVVTCSRRQDTCDALNDRLGDRGVHASACDVSDRETFGPWLQEAYDHMGGVDILVPNVSGMGLAGEEGWKLAFDVDIMGTVRGCEALKPALAQSGNGSIVIISSISGVEAGGGTGPYGTMKAALIAYASQLANDLAPHGIRVNTVSPGPIHVDDGFWGKVKADNPAQYDSVANMHGAGRLGTTQEVANAVAFLSSPAAGWVSGTNMIVDGAFTRRVQF